MTSKRVVLLLSGSIILVSALIGALLYPGSAREGNAGNGKPSVGSTPHVPLSIEANEGQTEPEVQVLSRGSPHEGAVALNQLLNDPHLVLGKQLRVELIDSCLFRNGGGCLSVIARQHDDALDAQGSQILDNSSGFGSNRVSQGDEPAHVRLVSDGHDGTACLRQLHGLRVNFSGLLSALFEIAVRAEPELSSV